MKKALVIILIAVVVVMVVAVGYIARNKDKLVDMALDRGFGTMESMVLQHRPASMTEDSVHVIFSNAIEKIRAGDVDAQKMQSAMRYFRECMNDKQLDSLEVVNILEEMKDL